MYNFNSQLPQHAQWANQQQGGASPSEQQKAKSLLEIQEQEERERLRQEEVSILFNQDCFRGYLYTRNT